MTLSNNTQPTVLQLRPGEGVTSETFDQAMNGNLKGPVLQVMMKHPWAMRLRPRTASSTLAADKDEFIE